MVAFDEPEEAEDLKTMPFKFQVIEVRYEGDGDDEFTIIPGYVMDGAIDEPELVILPTGSGQAYKFAMATP